MKKVWALLTCVAALSLFTAGCVTQKKKDAEVGWLKKRYHNLTSKYNYWFNADELLDLTIDKLNAQHTDNFNQLLEVYPYAATDPQSARGDLDNVIKKASMAIGLHRVSDWTDDSYTLIGEAQYLKRDFETAEATFKYIKDEYNPKDKKKLSKSSKKKKSSVSKKKKSSSKKKKKSSKKKKKSSKKKKGSSKKTPSTGKTTGAPAPAVKPAKAAEEPVVVVPIGGNPYDKGAGRVAAYPLAMVWYGRTLTEREKYDEAEFLFRDLWEDAFLPRSLYDELATAEAYLWIKQKQYDKALAPLAKAIEHTDKKAERARLSYLLAQLYERAGRTQEAFAAYETVLRNNPNYELEFNARLHQIEAGWANKQISSADANRSLERLAKDSKNAEYRDQIYYVLADIALQDRLKPEAIAYLRKSLDYNQSNANQRAESYLKLAELYFEGESFVDAKNYFDSTLTVLPPTDPRYKTVSDYANNLKEIARLIQTVTANDSIIRVFNMSPDERKDLAKRIKKQRDADAAKQAAVAAATPAAGDKGAAAPPVAGNRASSFYFYNDAFVKKGRRDFAKAWGERRLEDNWRRSNRPQTSQSLEDVAGADSLAAGDVSDTEVANIFQGLPRTDAELAVLHASNYEALYTLGTLFRDRLQNNKRSTATLEDVQTRYPDRDRYEKEIWYYSYLGFNDLGNKPRAQYYYDKLTGKYPASTYARALSDPNFLASTKEREKEVVTFYDQTYSMFTQGQYQTVVERCQEAPKKYGSTNPLMAKFALLSALSIGNLQGNDAYCKALTDVIGRFPESTEATRAKEIARVLGCKGFEVAETPKNDKKTDAIDEAFTVEDDKIHYFLVALTGSDVRLDDVKNAISDYNRENHKLDQLRLSNIFLGTDTNTPIIVIRKFDNKEQVMRYYNEVIKQKDFLGETTKKTYNKEFFATTQENYRRILKNKTFDGYREFFQEKYLKK
jgi:tetratricopeptide (TPR) repeat protein